MNTKIKPKFLVIQPGTIVTEMNNGKPCDWKIGNLVGTGSNNQVFEVTNMMTK